MQPPRWPLEQCPLQDIQYHSSDIADRSWSRSGMRLTAQPGFTV